MNRFFTSITTSFILCAVQGVAQGAPCHFNTVGMELKPTVIVTDSGADTSSNDVETVDYSKLSVARLEDLIGKYESYLSLRDSILNSKGASCKGVINRKSNSYKQTINTKSSNHKGKVHSYYDWRPRELNIQNLKDVASEVGLSNTLFVLAQALLETGNFNSRVCREYNNLFGLYDSKNKEYFRFARWEDSVVGYGRMIQNRYKGGNYLSFLKRIGYAEDPRYISKVASLAKELYHKFFVQ